MLVVVVECEAHDVGFGMRLNEVIAADSEYICIINTLNNSTFKL